MLCLSGLWLAVHTEGEWGHYSYLPHTEIKCLFQLLIFGQNSANAVAISNPAPLNWMKRNIFGNSKAYYCNVAKATDFRLCFPTDLFLPAPVESVVQNSIKLTGTLYVTNFHLLLLIQIYIKSALAKFLRSANTCHEINLNLPHRCHWL